MTAQQFPLVDSRPLLYDWLVSQDTDWAHAALVQLDVLTEGESLALDQALRKVCDPLLEHAVKTGMVWVVRRSYPSNPRLIAHRPAAVDRIACGMVEWGLGRHPPADATAGYRHTSWVPGSWVPGWVMAHADSVVDAFSEPRLHVCTLCLRGAP